MGRHQSLGARGGRQQRQRDGNKARSHLKTAKSLCPAWERATKDTSSTTTVVKIPRERLTMTDTVIGAFHCGGQLPFSAAEKSTELWLGSHVPDVH